MTVTLPTPLSPNLEQQQGIPFLKLLLERDTPVLLPMASVREVLTLPVQRVSAMPNMPACVLGLMNRRSRIFWAIDLAYLLGLSPLESHTQQYTVATTHVDGEQMGLVVRSVDGVQRFPQEALQSPLGGVVGEQWVPYVRGCILQERDILLVLEPEAILRSPLLVG